MMRKSELAARDKFQKMDKGTMLMNSSTAMMDGENGV